MRPPRPWLRPLAAGLGALVLLAPPAWSQSTDDAALVVDKQVDADGDGVFSDIEDANSATSPATFQVVLSNVGDRSLELVSAVDVLGETTIDLVADAACATLSGTLGPGQTVTCTFTLARYLRTHAGQPRNELTNRVEVVATTNDAVVTATDDATVRNPDASLVSVDVDLSTDADGDGVYTDDEEAAAVGADVPVRVEIQNTSPGAVVVTALDLTGSGLDGSEDLLVQCPALDQVKLWGGGGGDHDGGDHDVALVDDPDDGHGHERPTSTTCTTTLVGHAPAAGTSVTDTVTVTVGKRHNPQLMATASATARVRVAAPMPIHTPGPTRDPTPDPVVPPDTEIDPSAQTPTQAPPEAPVAVTEPQTAPAALPQSPATTVPASALPATGVPTGAALGLASLLTGLAVLHVDNRRRRLQPRSARGSDAARGP